MTTGKIIKLKLKLADMLDEINFYNNVFQLENRLINFILKSIDTFAGYDGYEISIQPLFGKEFTFHGKFIEGDAKNFELELQKQIYASDIKIDDALQDLLDQLKQNCFTRDFHIHWYPDFKPRREISVEGYEDYIYRRLREIIGNAILNSSNWQNFDSFDFRICLGGDFAHIRGKFKKGDHVDFAKSLHYALSTNTYLTFFVNYYIVDLENTSWEFEVMTTSHRGYIDVLYDTFTFNKKLMWESIWHDFDLAEQKLSNWFIKNLLAKRIQIAIESHVSDKSNYNIRINNRVATPALFLRILKKVIGAKGNWFEEFVTKYPDATLIDLRKFIDEKDNDREKFNQTYLPNFLKVVVPEYKYLREDQQFVVRENYKTLNELAYYSLIPNLLNFA